MFWEGLEGTLKAQGECPLLLPHSLFQAAAGNENAMAGAPATILDNLGVKATVGKATR